MKLGGRYSVITGASQGLGAVIAEQFVAEGSSVLLCGRSTTKIKNLEARLAPHLRKGQRIVLATTDVGSPSDIDTLAVLALKEFPYIDALINNAGVYGPMGAIEDLSWQDWVDAININLMGTVYCCRAFMPHFRERNYGKIVNLSGGGATNPLPRISAYAASKAAVVRFTETLAEEARDAHVDVNAVAPGALATQMLDQAIEAGPDKVGQAFYARMVKTKAEGGTPLIKGAELCVYLASAESDGITGKLISAVWDPWQRFDAHRTDLQSTDIYTLRRIVPRDRGKAWGD